MFSNLFDGIPTNSPFHLENDRAYQTWRASKLAQRAMPETIHIASPNNLCSSEISAITQSCSRHNFVRFCYQNPPEQPESALHHLGKSLHLHTLDANLCAEENGLTQITVKPTDTDQVYIPYTNRPLGWHTDGYYNAPDQQIHAWLLYCHQPAQQGGANGLLDHDIAYIRLRDQNPDWIRALMHPEAFIIPPNIEGGREIRPAHSGPVFSVSSDGKRLHMRYSARQRNIEWRNDSATRQAADFILSLLKGDDETYKLRLSLKPGEGIISNNILHSREAFTDAPNAEQKRLIYRARYYDSVN